MAVGTLAGVLRELGFEEREAELYLALLRAGAGTPSALAEALGHDRTTTYYALVRMVKRGYATVAMEGGVRTFRPTEPKALLAQLRETEDALAEAVPALEGQRREQGWFSVDVLDGKEGLSAIYRDAVVAGGEVLAFGVDEALFYDYDSLHFKRYLKQVDKGTVKERILTHTGAKRFGSRKSAYRALPKEYFSPTPVVIYGETVAILVWEPEMHIVRIKDPVLAASFRKHFELLWRRAKPIRAA